MRRKIIMIIMFIASLTVVMNACSTPAYAADNTTLTINNASIAGNTLHIEVTDSKSKIKSILDFDLQDYPATSEYITIQAVDADGNKSDVARVKNPRYTPLKTSETANITPTVTPTTQPDGAFTPSGAGTVMDDVVSNSKEFFTIKTDSNNTFYLIIDRQRNGDNVYLLNGVTEQDLLDFIRKNSPTTETTAATTQTVTKPTQTSEAVSQTTEVPQKTSKTNNNGTIIFIILAVAGVGGAAYYFKIYKPKKAKKIDESDIDDEIDANLPENDFNDGGNDEND